MEEKKQIMELVESLPQKVLPEVLTYLKKVKSDSNLTSKFSSNLDKIITEDKSLLEKLAQ